MSKTITVHLPSPLGSLIGSDKMYDFLSTTHLRVELWRWGPGDPQQKKKTIKRLNTSIVPDVTLCLQSFHYTIGRLTPWLLGNLEEIINVLFYLASRTWSEKGQNNHTYNVKKKKRKYAYSQYSCRQGIWRLWFVCVACCGSSLSFILRLKKSGNFNWTCCNTLAWKIKEKKTAKRNIIGVHARHVLSLSRCITTGLLAC